jgi:hypothetical protein
VWSYGNKIVLKHTSMETQLADILTKALGHVRFLELRGSIGVLKIGESSKD